MQIIVDTRERYAWKFTDQQAVTDKRALSVGDYAVEADGAAVAVVERKSVEDLVSTIVGGNLWTLLAALADVRHSAIVVEDRYSQLFNLNHVRPLVVTTQLAEAAVRYPMVPIVFAETRKLAQEWTLRFFGAALDHTRNETAGARHEQQLRAAPPASAGPSAAQVRAWAIDAGFPIAD